MAPIPQPPNGPPAPSGASQVTVVYEAGKVPGTLTQRLIKQYDKDGDFELTRDESGFDAATFERLDTDGDGKLSGDELDAWRTGPADLDVSLSLAPKPADCKATMMTPVKTAEDRGFTARHVETGRLVVRFGRQTIDLWALTGVFGPQNRFVLKQQFQFLFQQASGGKNYVEEKDLNGPNGVQFQQLKVIFEAADRDADGRLTQAEFDKYFDVQQQFVDIGLSLTPAVQTPTLFQLLDDNRDGRLSVRELRTAWDRLILLEPPGATEVTASAIQPSVTLRLTRTMERGNVAQQAQVQFVNGTRTSRSRRRPAARRGSARWTATATATSPAPSSSGRGPSSTRSTPTTTGSSAWPRPRRTSRRCAATRGSSRCLYPEGVVQPEPRVDRASARTLGSGCTTPSGTEGRIYPTRLAAVARPAVCRYHSTVRVRPSSKLTAGA